MTDTAAIRRGKNSALTALLGCSFTIGIVLAGTYPYLHSPQQEFLVQILGNVLLLGIGFWWLHLDSTEHGVRRSPLLDVGIVLAALVFVPYYFFRTRPPGGRARPVLAFFGLILVSALCSAGGMLAMSFATGDN